MNAVALTIPGWYAPFPWGRATEMQRSASQRAKVAAVSSPSGSPALDEQALVDRAKAGDRAALGQLLSHHGPRLYRTVLLPRLGDEARARDALSATYERVIQRLDQYTWQPCGMYPWLRVIAMRIALDMIRSGRHEVLFEADDLQREIDQAEVSLGRDVSAADQVQAQHDLEVARARVQDALDRINPRYAEAIRMRVIEEQPREEVARKMGVTPATFDVLLHRSMAALRKALRPEASEGQEP
jgi:RNA polymerase sigma-70 factor (ECF subfamily)